MQSKQGWVLAGDNKPDLDGQHTQVVGLAAGIGFAIVASLVVFIAAGIIIDRWLDASPIFTLIGVAIGLVGAGYQLYELVRVSDRKRSNGPLARTMARRMEARQRTRQ